jgi:adenine deaminase
MKYGGLTEDEALRLCTINGAKMLRIDNRVGSIEAGKDADVVIWNGHPLSTYSRVDTTFIEGDVYFDRATDLQQREALRKEKDERLKKEDDEAKKAKDTKKEKKNA